MNKYVILFHKNPQNHHLKYILKNVGNQVVNGIDGNQRFFSGINAWRNWPESGWSAWSERCAGSGDGYLNHSLPSFDSDVCRWWLPCWKGLKIVSSPWLHSTKLQAKALLPSNSETCTALNALQSCVNQRGQRLMIFNIQFITYSNDNS